VTCFFDASHGPATQDITWTPQWGTPRPVRSCLACAQRWAQYVQGQSGYPQPGYPQPGYPQPGYPQPDYGHPHYEQPRHQYGLGAVAAAGAAGLVGGMVVNELLDDDEHEHVEVVEHVVEVDHVDEYGGYDNDW
jgi:tellurium resistance protein TerD